MDVKIETRPAFTAVGLPYFGKNEQAEIPELWGTMNLRAAEVKGRDGLAYGLCKPMEADGRFHYLAGFGVTEARDLPQGMETWEVAEGAYALFPCNLQTIQETYQYAFETWLPGSAYTYKPGIDFELYTEAFNPHTGEETMYICIPVEEQ